MFLMYKPKGDRVRAEQVTNETVADLAKLFQGRLVFEPAQLKGVETTETPVVDKEYTPKPIGFEYPTFEGVRKVNLTEWVIQNEDGSYRKMNDKEFTERYEQARVVTAKS